jgi:putative SOS response-associated peptidase YedK
MCGRFSVFSPMRMIIKEFDVTKAEVDMKPNYNAAPSQEIPVILKHVNKKVLDAYRWGLIPHWAKDPKIGFSMINTRSESVTEKPAFRKTFESRRCLVIANGFFEWKMSDNEKIPYYITIKDRDLFAFAGVFDNWKSPDGKTVKSCSILTTRPNYFMSKIHDRMPVILKKSAGDKWLNENDPNHLISLLEPYPPSKMKAHIVSSFVNSPKNNSEECIKPVDKTAVLK